MAQGSSTTAADVRETRPLAPLSIVRVVVTTDGEQYTVVDLSGATDGLWIRRRILTKVLCIFYGILH